MDVFLSVGAGVILCATVAPVVPKRLAALAPIPNAESITICQPTSMASSSRPTNASPITANSTAAAPDRLRQFILPTLSGQRNRPAPTRLFPVACQPTALCAPALRHQPRPTRLPNSGEPGCRRPGRSRVAAESPRRDPALLRAPAIVQD